MKKMTFASVICLLLACSLHAMPLTWRFSGITSASSTYNGSSIGGLHFELRIFLDTDLVANAPLNLADVFFAGPHRGEVDIQGLGVKALDPFTNVQHFAPGDVTGVQFRQPAVSDILFMDTISTDRLHLTAISPTVPLATNSTLQSGVSGPNGLFLSGQVLSFSATTDPVPPTPVPESTSTLVLMVGAFATLTALRRRIG